MEKRKLHLVPYVTDQRSEGERVRSAYYQARISNYRESHGDSATRDIVAKAILNEQRPESTLASVTSERSAGTDDGLLDALEGSTIGVFDAMTSNAGKMVRWMEETDAERKAIAAEQLLKEEAEQAGEPEEVQVVEPTEFKIEARSCQIHSAAAALGKLAEAGNELAAVRCVDISVNYLTTLEGLAALPACDQIDASVNHISTFVGSQGLSLLRWLNLSKNRLTTAEGLTGCVQLTYLDISTNLLDQLGSFTALQNLRTLKLAGNALVRLEGLHGLPKLCSLDASHNLIADAAQIVFLPALVQLNLSDNKLTALGPVQQALGGLPQLRSLELSENPLRASRDYHMLVLSLPALQRLDGVQVSALLKEQLLRVKGKHDVADLEADTRNKYANQLRQKRASKDATLAQLQAQEREAEQGFLVFEQKMMEEQESCIAALRSLVAKGQRDDGPLSASELNKLKDQLMQLENERLVNSTNAKQVHQEALQQEARKQASKQPVRTKMLTLANKNPETWQELKRQELARKSQKDVQDRQERERELREASNR